MPDPLIDRLDHISVAVWDVDQSTRLAELLQGKLRGEGTSSDGTFRWAHWDIPGGKLEIIAPTDPEADTFLTRYLAKRGEGQHHLTFKVSSIDAAVARARAMGFSVVGLNSANPGWKEAFVHPDSAHGVLIQFAEFGNRSE